jgi:hypothetical protein
MAHNKVMETLPGGKGLAQELILEPCMDVAQASSLGLIWRRVEARSEADKAYP